MTSRSKTLALLGPALLAVSTPAFATGSFDCRATDGSGIGLAGSIGHVIGSPVIGARLHLGERVLATTDVEPQVVVVRSWIDEREIRIDLVDPDARRFEAQLRAQIGARGDVTGTLLREGIRHPVRCELE